MADNAFLKHFLPCTSSYNLAMHETRRSIYSWMPVVSPLSHAMLVRLGKS